MKRNERTNDLVVALMEAMQGHQAGMWTALPCIVVDFDAAKMTCSLRPAIKAKRTDEVGVETWIEIPVLVDVPVVFQSAGGYSLTFPVKPGDEALAVFSSRCIDTWWDTSAVSVQADMRMHDLSDAFALIGPRSRPRALSPTVLTTGVELRNDAGTVHIRLNDNTNVTVVTPGDVVVTADDVDVTCDTATITASGQINLTAPLVQINGNLQVSGTIVATGNVTGDGVSLNSHTHSGVQTGGSFTGPPA